MTDQENLHRTTSWGPVVQGGYTHRSRKLGKVSEDLWEYRATVGYFLFSLLFLVLSWWFAGFLVYSLLRGVEVPILGLLIVLGAAVGCGLFFRKVLKKCIFDFERGIYWERPFGRKRSEHPTGKVVQLANVVALQVLSEECEQNHSERRTRFYTSYELNFVLRNGKRRNIIDHGKLKAVVQEARSLSHKLEVPLLLHDEAWNRL